MSTSTLQERHRHGSAVALRRPAGRIVTRLAAAMLLTLLTACGEPANNSRAAFVLIDIHSEYAGEMQQAQTLTNYLLAHLTSGDSMAIAFIDNSSYTERNIIARAEFDHRPSLATQQKRQVRAELDAFLDRFRVPSAHSDITGGVLLARDFLREASAGQSYLFILSDMHEDLLPGMNRDMPLELDGVHVVAVNVKRQRRDNFDPQAYQQRLAQWQQRVEDSGGHWQIANDLARLENVALLR